MTCVIKTTAQSNDYARELVRSYLAFRRDILLDVALFLEQIERKVVEYDKAATMGSFSKDEISARSFYDVMIKPYILRGKLSRSTFEKTFRPDDSYVNTFIKHLSDDSASMRMYVRLLQSRPGEDQDDARIGYGVLEMLRAWAIRVLVARSLGLRFAVEIIDETLAFEKGHLLGFTHDSISDSYEAIKIYLESVNVLENELRIIHFSEQSQFYRGNTTNSELAHKYQTLKVTAVSETLAYIKSGVVNLRTIRVVALHKLRNRCSFASISSNTDLGYLASQDINEVYRTVELSESFFAALAMRDHFPTDDGTPYTIRCGITKSAERLSIMGTFKCYKGELVTPGYGIPLYDDAHNFLGLGGYSFVNNAEIVKKVCYGPSGRACALIIHDT